MAHEQRASLLRRWRDPVAFVHDVLINPQTAKPFQLYQAEVTFLREAVRLGPDGRLLYPDLMFCGPKKSGKRGFAAMIGIYMTVVLGGLRGEGFVLANDEDQSVAGVFTAMVNIIQASPLLRSSVKVTANRIAFVSTGAFIEAKPNDYRGFAGVNPTISIYDELWGFEAERSRRLFDEGVPSPARAISCRLIVSMAGFQGESLLLEERYQRGLRGDEIAPDLYATPGELLMYWTRELKAPWQSQQWVEQMRADLRPHQFLRMVRNEFVSSETSFTTMADWDRCVDPGAAPVWASPGLPVFAGVDASYKHDDSAIVICTREADGRVRVVWHKIFHPTSAQPLDFEETIERELRELGGRFSLQQVYVDPFQMVSLNQRLVKAGVPIVEYQQTLPHLTAMSTNLYELIRGGRLITYADDYVRTCVGRATAVEGSNGRSWKITKERSSHKVDVVVALAMAALAAVQEQDTSWSITNNWWSEPPAVPSDWLALRTRVVTPLPGESPEEMREREALIALNLGRAGADSVSHDACVREAMRLFTETIERS
jgi:phage terminase large subunit-like protein